MMAGKKGGVSSSMIEAFGQIWKKEGVPGFFKGLTINMVKITHRSHGLACQQCDENTFTSLSSKSGNSDDERGE
jgi:hypothetical protein